MTKTLLSSTLALSLFTMMLPCSAGAQVAGSTTTLGVSVVEMTQVAAGWSVKKTLLGKVVVNDAGDKVGTVEDLIISPDRAVSYVIVGAGGFVGLGRHDVAIPIKQIQDKAGTLVMAGATKDIIKAMPRFDYAADGRDRLVADAERDIATGKARVTSIEKTLSAANADLKVKMQGQVADLKRDIKSSELALSTMRRSASQRWQEFEGDVKAATARLRSSIDASQS